MKATLSDWLRENLFVVLSVVSILGTFCYGYGELHNHLEGNDSRLSAVEKHQELHPNSTAVEKTLTEKIDTQTIRIQALETHNDQIASLVLITQQQAKNLDDLKVIVLSDHDAIVRIAQAMADLVKK